MRPLLRTRGTVRLSERTRRHWKIAGVERLSGWTALRSSRGGSRFSRTWFKWTEVFEGRLPGSRRTFMQYPLGQTHKSVEIQTIGTNEHY
jgi:hypothetical protein